MNANTAAEYVKAWDSGEAVWTLEMGGLGPGYEQAIQVLVVELLRDSIGKPLPDFENNKDARESWGDDTVSRIDAACGGFSGAQVGAAKSLALQYLIKGPAQFFEGLTKARRDDMIQVSSFWPSVTRA